MDNNYKFKNLHPLQSANLLAKLTFTWIIKFLYKGTKTNIKVQNLYDNLPWNKSSILGDELEKNWNDDLFISKKRNKKPSLYRAIRKTFFWSYMSQGLLLFIQVCILRPIQPILLSIFIQLFSITDINETKSNSRLNDMYMYGGLIVLMSFIILFFTHHSNLMLSHIGMRIRIACCSLVYRKMLCLSKKSLGQSAAGKIVNLLSNDVSRFDLISILLHYIWIMPIQVALITYFIYREVQISALIGVGSLFILTVPVHAYVGRFTSILRSKIAQKTDSRVKVMAEIISGIQVIKMYAWEKPFANVAAIARRQEIDILTWASYVRGVILSSSVFLERTILFITVISYALFGHTITADKVFSLAQFFNLLQLSMAILYPLAISIGAETLISIKRIQEFLLLEEKQQSSILEDTSKTVVLENITASWVSETEILKNITVTIAPGALCAVIGPVGAGKSSLLQLLLGELPFESGNIQIGGTISYSSQESWLFASTVRKNILFGQPYDKELYENVVKVCALERDFELLPHGDKTMVGERGVSLSGGQKARINLARAIYKNVDIYLLDDPLSAVDTHVGQHLFEECIVKYLKKKTRILVTHQLQYLKKADHLVVINDGKIEAQGTYLELSKINLDFTKLLLAADESESSKQTVEKADLTEFKRKGSSVSEMSDNSEQIVNNEEENSEDIKESASNVYWKYARAGGNVIVLLGLLFFLLAGQVLSNCTDFWVSYWTSQEALRESNCNNFSHEFVDSNNKRVANEVIYYYINENLVKDDIVKISECNSLIATNTAIYIYTGLIVICIILLIIRSIYYFKVAMTASKNLHNRMFQSLLLAPMRFFDTNPSGRILNRFSRDMGMIDEILPRFMLEAIQIFLVMFGILVIVSVTNYYMIAVAFLLGIIFYKFRGWYVSNARAIKHLEGITRSPVFSHINASFNGITTIRASKIESLLIREFDLHQDTHTSSWSLLLYCIAAFSVWLDILSVFFVACVIFGFILLNSYGSINGSEVGLAVSQSLILTGMVQYGLRQTAEVVSQMTCVERVLEYTSLEKEGPQETPEDKTLSTYWPNSGKITFKNVYLRYSTSEPPVLKNLNFTVKSGEKIGIVGRTGAGKSSLITALFRLSSIEGVITIDEVETHTIGLNDLRKKISIIPQEPVLFSSTLRYNLDPFEEFSDADLWHALEEVELKDMANSLEFFVQEGGSNFSVGQRQLLCLARAILRNNKILVLDEATANVDPQTDALIQKTIRNKFTACTVLTVAHRLHTIMDSDKVLVMDAGMLSEFDHPHLLLQNPNGILHGMVEQTGSLMSIQLHDIAEKKYLNSIKDDRSSL